MFLLTCFRETQSGPPLRSMRSWHRNLRDIGWSLGAMRNEGLGPNSRCSAPNLRRAPTRPEVPTTLEARKRFSDQRRPPDQKAIVDNFMRGRNVGTSTDILGYTPVS